MAGYPQPSIAGIRPVEKEEKKGSGESSMKTLLRSLETDPKIPEHVTKKQVGSPELNLDAFILSNVLDEDESLKLRTRSEELAYSFWNAANPGKKDFRNADTVEVLDEELAQQLWLRTKHLLPEFVDMNESDPRHERALDGKWKAVGIFPRLLFVRYEEGGHFSPHTDGSTVVDFNHRSFYTYLVYLNTCVDGGATRIFHPDYTYKKDFDVDQGGRFRWKDEMVCGEARVDAGSILVFSQDLPHEGEPVGPGSMKYIIRTDVIYERCEMLLTSPEDQEAYRLFKEAELMEVDGKYDEATKLFRRCAKLSPKFAKLYGL